MVSERTEAESQARWFRQQAADSQLADLIQQRNQLLRKTNRLQAVLERIALLSYMPDDWDGFAAIPWDCGNEGDIADVAEEAGVHVAAVMARRALAETPCRADGDDTCLADIIIGWLREHGYEGLYNVDGSCGCKLGDLMPCDQPDRTGCRPGFLLPCRPETCEQGGECEFHVGPRPKAEEDKG